MVKKIEKEEFEKHFVPALKEFFPKADADGDGKLNEEEVANMMKFFDEHAEKQGGEL